MKVCAFCKEPSWKRNAAVTITIAHQKEVAMVDGYLVLRKQSPGGLQGKAESS